MNVAVSRSRLGQLTVSPSPGAGEQSPGSVVGDHFTKREVDTLAMAATEEDPRGSDAGNRVTRDLSVDADWYRERYPDVAVAGADPSNTSNPMAA